MPRTKDDKLEARRKREILEAAATCFVRDGFHAASMRAICKEAGLSAGAVYNYFPSKDAIIEGMAEWEREDVAELAAYLRSEGDALTALVEGTRAMVAETTVEEAQLYAELIAEAGRNPTMQAKFTQSDDELKQAIQETVVRGQADGRITSHESAETLTLLVLSIVDGVAGRIGYGNDMKPTRLADMAADAVNRLLRP